MTTAVRCQLHRILGKARPCTGVTIPTTSRERVLGAVAVFAAVVYLTPFVPRGWIPHDEGMLGQSAVRVLQGDLPHLDYEEAYTGGLTYVYAALFRSAGIDLVNVRWLLLVAAAGVAWLSYTVTRRQLRPLGAALATWIAITWSFPNYFAGLPSWWLLLCAVFELRSMIRYVETQKLRYIVFAAAAAGLAMAIKQTGAYLIVALVLWVLDDSGMFKAHSSRERHLDRVMRWAAGAAALVFAAVMLTPRLSGTEGLYLFAPAAATAVVLIAPRHRYHGVIEGRSTVALAMLAGVTALVPVALLLMPYILGHHFLAFVNGALILPQKRLAFASLPMSSAIGMVIAVPLLGFVILEARRAEPSVSVTAMAWALAIGLPIAALWNHQIYQVIWQSARAVAALLPIVIAWRLVSGHVQESSQRSVLFASAAVLAWSSLNQYPFAAPIYFCYTTPLVVTAGVAAADAAACLRTRVTLPLATLLVLFAVLVANRGGIDPLGHFYAPVRLEADLDLPRAHLRVDAAEGDAYRRLVTTIALHHRGGQLIAGPDCPEVYFLAGLKSPSGALFDFFSDADPDDAAPWLNGEVIIINHRPQFSPVPSATLVAALQRNFAQGERIGPFEVRWR